MVSVLGERMTPIDIAEARRMYSKTTLGLWRSVRGELLPDGHGSIAFFGNADADSNAEFAAWSHNNTPALLGEIERLRRILAHVPGGVAIAAKEAAGFGDRILPKGEAND